MPRTHKEPFNKFVWDLSAYDTSGQHEIVVEAEDALGLKKSSIGIPVTLTVIHAPKGVQAFLARYRSYVVTGRHRFCRIGSAYHSSARQVRRAFLPKSGMEPANP